MPKFRIYLAQFKTVIVEAATIDEAEKILMEKEPGYDIDDWDLIEESSEKKQSMKQSNRG